MPVLTDVVSNTISAASATLTVPGFGKPLVLSQGVPAGFTNRYREYSSTAGLVTDGFATTHPTYLALQQAFAQSPRPPLVGVGRRANKTTQSVQFTLGSVTAGDVYSLTLYRASTGVSTTVTRVSTGVVNTDATAFAATIAAVAGFAGTTAASAVISIVAADGVGTINGFSAWTVNGSRGPSLTYFDNSADPGIAADLAAILAENGTWYGLTVDSCSKAEILAAAVWAEANKKLLAQQSSDFGVADSGTSTDVASNVQTSAYKYTAILFNGNSSMAFAGLCWQAFRFAVSPQPGNDTWNFNSLASVAIDNLTETEFATLGTKNATGYVALSGVNYTAAGNIANAKSGGKTGSGQFIDTTRFLDWSTSDITLAVFGDIAPGTGIKVPFTDKGGASLQKDILGSLQRGETFGGYVVGSSVVNVPLVASISPTDRANRNFTGVTWTSRLTGAVHLVSITGAVST